MNNFKKALCLIFALSLLLPCLPLFSFASASVPGGVADPSDHIHETGTSPELRAFVRYCTNGTCDGTVMTACMGEDILMGTASHTPLFSEECIVYYYGSREYAYCPTCDTFFEEYPLKVCWEMHISCSKGPVKSVCSANYGPEVFEGHYFG